MSRRKEIIRLPSTHRRMISTTVAALLLFSMAAQTGLLSASAAGPASGSNSPFIDQELTGLTWDGKEFIGTYGTTNVPLINISLDGRRVTPFATSFIGKDEVYVAVGDGKAGFPSGYFYVSSDLDIYVIDPNGSNLKVFSSPPGASRISYVTFDTVGSWGYSMLALDDNGLLWSIASNGTARVLDNFSNFGTGPLLKPEGIAVASQSFGSLAGYLFITLEGAERIVAIPPGNSSKVMTLYHFTKEEPERIIQIQPQSDLYAAEFDSGTMLRVPAANFTNYIGSLLVITEGENEPNGTLNVLRQSGNNVTVTRIGSVTGAPHFEGVSWVPTSAQPTTSESTTTTTTTTTGMTTSSSTVTATPPPAISSQQQQGGGGGGGAGATSLTTFLGAAAVIVFVVVVILAAFLVSRRGRRR
jgi:hypothetical protein